jgi:hypothetical protein
MLERPEKQNKKKATHNLLSHSFEFRKRGNIEFTAEILLLCSRVLKLIDFNITDPTVIRP